MEQLAYDAIDLRIYVRVLFRNWLWILTAVMVCAAAAMGTSLVMSPTYEASALIAITDARYLLQFDSRFETTDEQPSYKVYTDLAVSSDVLQALWSELDQKPAGMEGWQGLKGALEAESGSDNSLLKLTVQLPDPAAVARVANVWAEVLVVRVNDIYGSSGEDLLFFANQLERAESDLETAETALIGFQSTNKVQILQNQLAAKLADQNQYLEQLRAIDNLTRDIRDLRTQLLDQPAHYRVTFGDRLTVLSLQVRSFNAQTGMPIQLQVTTPDALSDQTLDEQLELLDELISTLTARADDVPDQLSILEPEILDVQRSLELASTEYSRLTRSRDLASDTYTMLARKVEESQIAAADDKGQVVLASYAAVPSSPVGPKKLMNTAIGAVVGGMLSVLGVFAIEWWRQDNDAA
ncbi:MAG: Wzz/FepE/Etk N-terminal domain-containing protein [Anaerolineae bacterium]|nr:Wzz/FepE/Etk N-terminal domain-containing protein [Anaerolineae bacterium]